MPKKNGASGRMKPVRGDHVLFDHMSLMSPQTRSVSMDSNTSGDSENDFRGKSFSEDDEDERDSIDEDMYTTKAYRMSGALLKTRGKGKSPLKVGGKSSLISFEPSSSSVHNQSIANDASTGVLSSKTQSVDLSSYIRAKNTKTIKNRHVSRQSQRNRKLLESSIWHSEDDSSPLHDASPSHNKSSSLNYSSCSSVTSTSVAVEKNAEMLSKESKSDLPINKSSTVPVDKVVKSSLSKSNTLKKKRSNNSGIGHIMKNIGVKGAHHRHNSPAPQNQKPPSTPRLVRTPTAQASLNKSRTSPQPLFSPPHTSFPSSLSTPTAPNDLSSHPISSSPFIQSFDSHILRTPTPVTATSSAQSGIVPPPPPLLSPKISLHQSEDDHSNLGEGVTSAIFQALFGTDNVNSGATQVYESNAEQNLIPIPPPRWDDSDDEEEEEDEHCLGPDLSHCKDIDLVDEKWLTDLIKSRSNSRSSSLDLTRRDRTSPKSSDGVGNMTLTPSEFENAMHKNFANSNIEEIHSDTCVASPTPLTAHEKKHYPDHLIPSFSTSVHFHKKQLNSSTPPKGIVTTDSILQNYITPTLITQLVLQLPHDDDRLTSPRLSVLKALYKNCPSLRTTVTHTLVVAAHSRFLRCEESRRNAREYGCDVNEASLSPCSDNVTGFDGKPKSNPFSTWKSNQKREENPGTLVRDHDSSLVELTLFILITECLPSVEVHVSPTTTSSQKYGDQTATDEIISSISKGTFDVVVSVVCNVMRCYGSRLGKSSGSVEQPGILKGIFKIIDILMSNKVDCDSGRMAVSSLLRRILHRWPQGNHVQEEAFIKLVAHILVHMRPLVTRPETEDYARNDGDSICLSHVLRHTAQRRGEGSVVQAALRKLVQSMSSAHFKVASQAIQIVMQLSILHPHFISNPNAWKFIPYNIHGNEIEPSTAVEALVEVLRDNRCHWHPRVRNVSEEALDNLLEYL